MYMCFTTLIYHAHLADTQPPVTKERNEGDTTLSDKANPEARRTAKVRGAKIPQEYELAGFVENIENPHLSWNTSIPACQWNGMNCNLDGYVTGIDWSRLGYEGLLRWERLPHTVIKILLYANQLSGILPFNVFPSELSYLNLKSNLFRGQLEFSQLPHRLGEIYLDQNMFEGGVDLCHLPLRLTSLSIYSMNSVEKLFGDVELHCLPQTIRFLDLSRNRFSGTLDLQHLPPSLAYFSCEDNCFKGLVQLCNLPPGIRLLILNKNAELYGEVDFNRLPASLTLSIENTKISVTNQNE